MKILHLSDLHFGRSLYKTDIFSFQKKLCDEITAFIADKEIDAVLISGDIYDTAVSSAGAAELWDYFAGKIVLDRKIPLLVTSGNHDGAERLTVCSDILNSCGLYIRGSLKCFDKPVRIGNADVYMLPFFEKGHAESLFGKSFESLEEAYLEILNTIKTNFDKTKTNIVMAHTFVVADKSRYKDALSGSERSADIMSVGGVNGISPEVFDGFDYVALGHIHKPMTIKSKNENTIIRYSGTVLKYDFSECGQEKQFTVYDTDTKSISTYPCPEIIKLRCIEGDFEEIKKQSASLDGTEYVKIVFHGTLTPETAEILKSRIPKALKIIPAEKNIIYSLKSSITEEEIMKMDIVSLAEKYLREYYGKEMTDSQREILLSAYRRYERREEDVSAFS